MLKKDFLQLTGHNGTYTSMDTCYNNHLFSFCFCLGSVEMTKELSQSLMDPKKCQILTHSVIFLSHGFLTGTDKLSQALKISWKFTKGSDPTLDKVPWKGRWTFILFLC